MVVLPVAVDGAAGELVRRDRDAVRGRVAHQHRVAARHRGRVRGGRAACRFRGAVKVQLQLRGAGDVDRRVEGHRRRDRVADRVGVVGAGGGGQRDRRDGSGPLTVSARQTISRRRPR